MTSSTSVFVLEPTSSLSAPHPALKAIHVSATIRVKVLGNINDGRPGEEADWEALRVAAGGPESGVELLPNESFPLEYGFEALNGVDFRKGCYVGQEVTARMKHKTELRKGLRRVLVEGSAPVGTEILAEDGRPAGTLFTQAGGEGLAYLRFDRTDGSLRAGDAVLRLAEDT